MKRQRRIPAHFKYEHNLQFLMNKKLSRLVPLSISEKNCNEGKLTHCGNKFRNFMFDHIFIIHSTCAGFS